MDMLCDHEDLDRNAAKKVTGAALSAAAGLLLAGCSGYMEKSGERSSECHAKGGHIQG
jgi:hypothetical protein